MPTDHMHNKASTEERQETDDFKRELCKKQGELKKGNCMFILDRNIAY